MVFCRICFSQITGRAKSVSFDQKLADLHEELCDYDNVVESNALGYCSTCEHLLRKFYNFRQKCRRAESILKKFKKNKKSFEHLQELMPRTVWFSTSSAHQGVYDIEWTDKSTKLKSAKPYNDNHLIDIMIPEDDIKKDDDIDSESTVSCDSVKQEEFLEVEFLEDSDNDAQLNEEISNASELKVSKEESLKEQENSTKSWPQLLLEPLKKRTGYSIKNMKSITKPTRKRNSSLNVEPLTKQIKNLINSGANDDPLMKQLRRSTKTKRIVSNLKASIENDIKVLALEVKNKVLTLLREGQLDLGMPMSTETFLEMYRKYDKKRLLNLNLLEPDTEMERIKKFLLHLRRLYNPDYAKVFDIQYLATRELQLAEFEYRKQSDHYLKSRFKCEKCYRGFDIEGMLEYHSKWHEESRPFACDICSMRFNARKLLLKHLRDHSTLYRCKLCPLQTYEFDVMVNHFGQHQGMEYTCDLCSAQFSSKSSLGSHRQVHGTHVCEHCGRRFLSSIGLDKHIQQKHNGAVSCDKCSMTFETVAALTKHTQQTHEGVKMYKCFKYPECEQLFATSKERSAHALELGHRHSGRRLWGTMAARAVGGAECPKCQRTFASTAGLRIHMQMHTGSSMRFRCREFTCGKQFRSIEERQAHVIETGHRLHRTMPFQQTGELKTCNICQEQVPYTSRTAMYRHHVRVHPAAPYKTVNPHEFLCELCGKSLRSVTSYTAHVNKHVGARPHACSRCPARFHSTHTLLEHSYRHMERSYPCSECGKKFGSGSNLYNHMRLHIGDRCYKCHICDKGFLLPNALRDHIKGVHYHIRRVKKTKAKEVKVPSHEEITSDASQTSL